jgi:hypothetical protein
MMRHTWARKSKLQVRQTKIKIKSMLIIFFHMKGIVYKQFVLARQTVNTAYDCNVLQRLREMCKNFALNFGTKGLAVTSRQRTISHLFLPGIFWPKTTWLPLPTRPTFLFFPIENKTERPPLWHNWGGQGRIAGGAEHPHRTRLSECT